MALNEASVFIVQQTDNWCEVCGSGTHETKQYEAKSDSVNYVGNAQRGGFNKIMAILTTLVGGTILTSHGVGIKTKIMCKGLTNIVLKRLDNNTTILTKAQILVHQTGDD